MVVVLSRFGSVGSTTSPAEIVASPVLANSNRVRIGAAAATIVGARQGQLKVPRRGQQWLDLKLIARRRRAIHDQGNAIGAQRVGDRARSRQSDRLTRVQARQRIRGTVVRKLVARRGETIGVLNGCGHGTATRIGPGGKHLRRPDRKKNLPQAGRSDPYRHDAGR